MMKKKSDANVQTGSIILFGSSLEDKCTERSDIVLAIISNVTRAKLLRSNSYDRFTTVLYNIDDEQTYDIQYYI